MLALLINIQKGNDKIMNATCSKKAIKKKVFGNKPHQK